VVCASARFVCIGSVAQATLPTGHVGCNAPDALTYQCPLVIVAYATLTPLTERLKIMSEQSPTVQHPAFPQPDNIESMVWRYMDLPKLIALLGQKALFLPRLDKLGDPHEGAITRPFKDRLDSAGPETAKRFAGWRKGIRTTSFVSCWHQGEFESEAMWRLYCGTQGVAIQTTYAKLKNSVHKWNNPSLGIGLVSYRDYDSEDLPGLNMYVPIMSKRIAFKHEQEVRIVWTTVGYKEYPAENTVWEEGTDGNRKPAGMLLPWDAEDFVENIYINPYAKPWYGDVVKTTVEKHSSLLAGKIQWSQLRNAPYY
jgi:hypothetical protein